MSNMSDLHAQYQNEGYRAQAMGKDMVKDNPYPSDTPQHWLWREGFLDAVKDSQ